MEETRYVVYLKCGFCTAKNHCAACSGELAEALLRKPGIEAAALDLPAHTLRLEHRMDPADLEDLLDAMGLITE